MSRLVAVLPQRGHTWQAELYLSADESVFADWLAGVQTKLDGVAVGSYPVAGEYDYRSRLVVRGLDRDRVRSALARLREHVSSAGWLVREGGDA